MGKTRKWIGDSWRPLFLAYLSLFIFGFGDNIRGPLFPEILKYFSVNDTLGSMFFAVSSMMGLIGGYLAQLAIKKIGSRRGLQLALGLMMTGLIAISISPTFFVLLLSSLIFGMAMGSLGVIQNFLVIKCSPPHRLQQIQSGLHSMYGAASFLAPLLVSVAYRFHPSWRLPFCICGILTGLVLLLALPKDDRMDQIHIGDNGHFQGSSASRREQLYFSTVVAAYVVAEIIVSSRLSLFLRREENQSLEESSSWAALFFACLLAGRVMFTFWRPPVKVKTQMLISLVGCLLCFLVGLFVNPWGFVLSGLAMAPFYPLAMAASGRLFSKQVSSVMAFVVAVTSVFVVSMHLGVGYLTEIMGIRKALMLGPGFVLLALLMLIGYTRIFKRPFDF